MKLFQKKWVAVMLFMSVSAGFTACSSDDDSPTYSSDDNSPATNLETPKYESVSAKYNITSAGSDLKSIELTASGDYLIVKKGSSTQRARTTSKQNRWAVAARMVTRAGADWYNNIIQGKFTKISDTEFRLEGYGTIVITGLANDAVDLDITLTDGSKVEVTAQRSTQMAESTMTNNLCRTWSFVSLRLAFKGHGFSYDKEYGMNELNKFVEDMRNLAKKYNDDWDDEDEEDFDDYELFEDSGFPTQVIFTKAGSYVVFYKDNSLAVATWAWDNDSQTRLRYSWNYADMGYDTGSWEVPYGIVEVGFRGNQLFFTESSTGDLEDEDEDFDEVKATWYMSEVK